MTKQATLDCIVALERAKKLLAVNPPTIRQVIEAGDRAIEAAGLNPWCINEGMATGEELLRDFYWIDSALDLLYAESRSHLGKQNEY